MSMRLTGRKWQAARRKATRSLAQISDEEDRKLTQAAAADPDNPIIDERTFARMRPAAVLVNLGRGSLVDEAALTEALAAGRIAGAALDVFQREPLPTESPLWRMPNVILTSHIASYSEEGDVAHHQRTLQILGQVIGGSLPERKVVINKALYDMLSPWAMARSRAEGPAAAPR